MERQAKGSASPAAASGQPPAVAALAGLLWTARYEVLLQRRRRRVLSEHACLHDLIITSRSLGPLYWIVVHICCMDRDRSPVQSLREPSSPLSGSKQLKKPSSQSRRPCQHWSGAGNRATAISPITSGGSISPAGELGSRPSVSLGSTGTPITTSAFALLPNGRWSSLCANGSAPAAGSALLGMTISLGDPRAPACHGYNPRIFVLSAGAELSSGQLACGVKPVAIKPSLGFPRRALSQRHSRVLSSQHVRGKRFHGGAGWRRKRRRFVTPGTNHHSGTRVPITIVLGHHYSGMKKNIDTKISPRRAVPRARRACRRARIERLFPAKKHGPIF